MLQRGIHIGQFTIGGTGKALFPPQNVFYGVGGARLKAGEGEENVGFVVYGPSAEDEAVDRLRQLGSRAGIAAHACDLVPGIQAYDSPFVLWVLLIYATLRGTNWVQQIDSMLETPAVHFNLFTASVETLKRLGAAHKAGSVGRDISTDAARERQEDRSPYSVKTLIQYLDNLAMQEKAAGELPPADGVDPTEDPALLMLARVATSRHELDAWPDVQRLKVHMPSVYNFDAEALSEWVKQVCRDRDLNLREVGELRLDEFCDLVKKPSEKATERKAAKSDPPSDLITFDDVSKLLGHTSKKRLQNAVAEWRKAGHTIDDPSSYAVIRPLVIATWSNKAKMFPANLADAKRILKNLS